MLLAQTGIQPALPSLAFLILVSNKDFAVTGQLFTQYFLTDGIRSTEAWQEVVRERQSFAAFKQSLIDIIGGVSPSSPPNEAATEQDVVRKVFDLLGWRAYLPQQGSKGNEDVPDHLLFADENDKERANARTHSEDRYQDALVIEESKRFGLPLDSRDRDDTAQRGTPHGQILRYLSTAESATDGRIRWGILTNGAVWRLYDYRTRPRASAFYEADVQTLLLEDNDHALRVFFLLLRRAAFTLREGATTTFLEEAIAEGQRYEQRVAADLSEVVFTHVFPNLVAALAARLATDAATGSDLTAARHAALIFLYRLLFILYAEDRGLLPVNDSRYDDYGLRKRVRDDVAARMNANDTFSNSATILYDRLTNLFRVIDQGDPSIGLPPYNGGLFAPESAPLLDHVRLPDNIVAEIIYELSHTRSAQKGETARSFVNYRDMSVQQLGSIYERLLEQEPVRGDDGDIAMRPNPYARKDSGSFYTPQELVDLIVEKTLDPLVEERLTAFEQKAAQLKRDRRPKTARQQELAALDPAAAVLDLKILDPAMGSGHFLVTAVDFLSDYIADLVEYAPGVPDWLADDPGAAYVSPLVARIAAIRQEILLRARESDWTLNEEQLTDQAIIRRMVLKRCIYGVDKNPLAVELAKVSLWLHSFTVGAPLSFLDHHLRCGDSLLGMRVTEAVGELRRMGSFFIQSAVAGAEASAEGMEHIEMLSDADVSEVRQSASLFKEVEETTSDLRGLLDTLCGLRWLTAGMKKKERTLFELPLLETLDKHAVDAFKLLAHGPDELSHGQTDAIRHSRESGNPSSPESLDSDLRRSDDESAPDAATSGSAGLQPAPTEGKELATGVSEGQAPALPHHSDAGDTVRHSRESGNPSSSAAASSGSAGLQPAPTEGKELATGVSEGQAPALPHHVDASDAVRHSGESRNPSSSAAASSGSAGLQPAPTEGKELATGVSEGQAPALPHHSDAGDTVRHSGESVDARPTSERIDARPTGESIDARHSRESGNASSSESLDSGFHRSDDPQAAPSSGSAGLQPASEEGNDPAADTSGETLTQEFTALWHNARAIADRETFLHWEAAFPGVWAQWQDANPSGGFDAVIGNPPWDRIKLQEVEWIATRAPELARAPTAAARRTAIKELRAQGDPLAADFDAAKARADSLGKLVRASGHYPLLGGGDINLYSLFVERALRLVNANGLVGLLTPSGIYADKTAAKFFKSVSTRGRVAGLYDFENKKIFFKDVHASFKFCALIVGGAERQFDETACAFFLHDTKTIDDPDRCFPLAPDDFARVNPNTGTAPVFRTRRDADITRAIYARHPVLVNRSDGTDHKTWPVKYQTMFHMTNDSHLFRTAAQLEDEGFYPVQGNRWKRGKDIYLPLYQGRMIHQFDHRANSVRINPESTHNPYLSEEVSEAQHADPNFLPQSQYWVPASNVEPVFQAKRGYAIGFRDIARPTDVRTSIASVLPMAGYGNTLPLLLDDNNSLSASLVSTIVANLNSVCVDFIARQKAQGTHLNWFIVEQLPVIAPDDYDRKFGETTARELVRDHVLRLTYTAHDLAPFARDLGHVGPPFIWNEEKRRHLRARLDALYFHLYGISRDDADYILSTFPIVQRQDETAFNTFRTRNLILAYMNALNAGDTETVVDL